MYSHSLPLASFPFVRPPGKLKLGLIAIAVQGFVTPGFGLQRTPELTPIGSTTFVSSRLPCSDTYRLLLYNASEFMPPPSLVPAIAKGFEVVVRFGLASVAFGKSIMSPTRM